MLAVCYIKQLTVKTLESRAWVAEELEGPAGLSKDFQQLALTKMTIKDIKFIVFDLHFFCISHLTCCSLFDAQKKVYFTVRKIETAVVNKSVKWKYF